ncbi:Thioredoxin-1 [Erysiphe necator]|uniref:Putative cop c 2-like protein n=1 Tax=Uncinula necator TaxID=52586 RepID=A0A0B1PGP8_UNCNE|nr:Thioredoxin-1 [Erysiphe necator]KHJ35709.1 putative cop c 2-like protein [Erysiphe necator]
MVVNHIKSKAQFEAAVRKYRVVVVEGCAELSILSRLMAAFNRRMSREHPKAYYLNFDVDQVPEIRHALKMRTTPSYTIFRDGLRVGDIVGLNPRGLEMTIAAALVGIETPSPSFAFTNYPSVKAPGSKKKTLSNYQSPKFTAVQT